MIPPVCLAGAFFSILNMSLFKKPGYCCFWYQNRPKSLCGKNQFGHDSSGLPSRGSFFSKKTRPFSKKHVYLCFGVKIDQKSDPYLTLGFLTF